MTRRSLGGLALLGVAAGAVYALRVYLQDPTTVRQGDVQIVLDTGVTIEPDPSEAQEFVDIARKVLEIGG